ncbi:hypothetical protein LLE49_21590 [Alicyclobacillus tolerans]|uniref:purine-cytosine permease family protein n=1 Tax=Alicyclobacillus tolerans TaxID=90970 RepID=UPI001F1C0678|nr:hypothetical protein [Alicyclobacillus tolerans]MCF8567318.1 hypothetical protein [Alicyclobacillus tolerans]
MNGVEKRKFNRLVNNPVLEDYSLRYAPSSFRKWSPWAVYLSGIGGIAAMAGYAIGGSLAIQYGFQNAFWAISLVSVIIFLTGWPIAYEIAKNNIDMDLLTRAAGFGYLGSTLTSLIYASFTFIYFSLEGAIMAQAITDYFHIPIFLSYLICGVLIIPLVLYGMTFLSKFQKWTQPVWLILLLVALFGVAIRDPHSLTQWIAFKGQSSNSGFSWLMLGAAGSVLMSLVAQIGEQADYLRFMPDVTEKNRRSWMWAVILGGPGWILIGGAQNLMGTYLASYVAPRAGMAHANVPFTMFDYAFQTVFTHPAMALAIATALVLLSQLKINVTNAYSGSLSWSNFFSRTLHTHPGRVVWLVFQVAIGVLIMEMGIFGAIDKILAFYSNVAVAWIGAVVADLVINKKLLKLSPNTIEFKRAHLYNFNPVGFGSMILASLISIVAYFGTFGAALQAYSPFLALLLAMIFSPIIAVVTKGKYYIARNSSYTLPAGMKTATCSVCNHPFEVHDLAQCPFHAGAICSLCCSLEAHCHDECKTKDEVAAEQEVG